MTLGAGKPAQECESGKTVTGDLSLRATGGFSWNQNLRSLCACLSGPFSPVGGWGEAKLVFQGPGQVDWRNKIRFLGLLLCPRSQAVY